MKLVRVSLATLCQPHCWLQKEGICGRIVSLQWGCLCSITQVLATPAVTLFEEERPWRSQLLACWCERLGLALVCTLTGRVGTSTSGPAAASLAACHSQQPGTKAPAAKGIHTAGSRAGKRSSEDCSKRFQEELEARNLSSRHCWRRSL